MNALEQFNITIISNQPDEVILTMPISDQTKQPFGFLHGGMSALLAETAASIGANTSLNDETRFAVGVDLNIHHLNSARQGLLKAVATPLHIGYRLQTWQVNIYETKSSTQIASATVTLTNQQRKD